MVIVLSLGAGGLASGPGTSACPKLSQEDRKGSVMAKSHPSFAPVSSAAYAALLSQGAPEAALDTVNGIDAYIYDLGCQTEDTAICLEHRDDDLADPDLSVTFRDASFQAIGASSPDTSSVMCGSGGTCDQVAQLVPDGTRFVEVTAQELTSGNAHIHMDSGPPWAAFTLVPCG